MDKELFKLITILRNDINNKELLSLINNTFFKIKKQLFSEQINECCLSNSTDNLYCQQCRNIISEKIQLIDVKQKIIILLKSISNKLINKTNVIISNIPINSTKISLPQNNIQTYNNTIALENTKLITDIQMCNDIVLENTKLINEIKKYSSFILPNNLYLLKTNIHYPNINELINYFKIKIIYKLDKTSITTQHINNEPIKFINRDILIGDINNKCFLRILNIILAHNHNLSNLTDIYFGYVTKFILIISSMFNIFIPYTLKYVVNRSYLIDINSTKYYFNTTEGITLLNKCISFINMGIYFINKNIKLKENYQKMCKHENDISIILNLILLINNLTNIN